MIKLPTAHYGMPGTEEEMRIVEDAIQDMVARLNSVPKIDDLPLRVVVSVLVSVCCAQNDPVQMFRFIGHHAAVAIQIFVDEPAGAA